MASAPPPGYPGNTVSPSTYPSPQTTGYPPSNYSAAQYPSVAPAHQSAGVAASHVPVAPTPGYPGQAQPYYPPPGSYPPQQAQQYSSAPTAPPSVGPPAYPPAHSGQQYPAQSPAGPPNSSYLVPTLVGQAGRGNNFHDPTGKYKLVMQGAFVAVEASVSKQEGFKAEAGAMVAMSSNIDLVAKADGGVGAACLRCCCAGEAAFFSYFHLKEGSRGDVLLAPANPGDIMMLHLSGLEEWRIQKGSYMACDESVRVGTVTQNFAQGCCSGEGFFILKASGTGRLLLNSYGSIIRYGEAIIARFTGPGTIYVQTRSLTALAVTVAPYIPLVQQQQGGGGADIGGFGGADIGGFG